MQDERTALESVYLVHSDFYLGLVILLLRLNGLTLGPPEPDIPPCEFHGMSPVNPHMLLETRYKPLNQKLKDKEMLFVILGN